MRHILFLSILALFGFASKQELKVTVKNPIDIKRANETVEIKYADITKSFGNIDGKSLVVFDASGSEIPSQVIFEGEENPQKLIFQATVGERGIAVYTIKIGTPQKYPLKAYGRFVPERYDDYAWENDKIAFRIYGLALIPKDGPSNGIDIWNKRTSNMIIDKWYSDYLVKKISYHKDHGEGCDCFKVGRTLGAGGMAPFVNDSIWLGINFQNCQTIDNGPIRTSFKLVYPGFYVNNKKIVETRTISLDAGSQLTAVVEEYRGYGSDMKVASGIAKRKEGNSMLKNQEKGYMTYKLDVGNDGITFLGVVATTKVMSIGENVDHVYMSMNYVNDSKLLYYMGAGWNKWGFETEGKWNSYIEEFAAKINNPLIVELN